MLRLGIPHGQEKGMRIVFIGRQTFANHCFVNWLARRHDVVAFFRADITRYTIGYRLRWVRRRLQRAGVLRTVDQVLYTLYYTLTSCTKPSRGRSAPKRSACRPASRFTSSPT